MKGKSIRFLIPFFHTDDPALIKFNSRDYKLITKSQMLKQNLNKINIKIQVLK